ncbi:hypothetical protein JHK87_037080 [Glycine soja]|nr:hypothetical protein JHK87_037080 [Glycine soja]
MDSISPKPQENNNNNNNNIPKPMTRSEPANSYPTTFVQADTTSFKQVVQMLTGSSETAKQAAAAAAAASSSSSSSKPANPIPPMKSIPNKKQQPHFSKLYERRTNSLNLRNSLHINPLTSFFSNHTNSPRKADILSPSILDFPALVLSPVTPLIPDPFDRSNAAIDSEAEVKAIKEKGFFLHPSPRDKAQPLLLPLFPTTSPRASSGSFGLAVIQSVEEWGRNLGLSDVFLNEGKIPRIEMKIGIETRNEVNGDMRKGGKGSGACDDEREEKMGGSDGNVRARKQGVECASCLFVYAIHMIFADLATHGWCCIN